MSDDRRIGVFDSGVGGLSVVKQLQKALPNESFYYLGDTANLPYGTKSPDTIKRYVAHINQHFQSQDLKLIVVACHSVSAHALQRISEANIKIFVVGVIERVAMETAANKSLKRVLILSTEATISSNIYHWYFGKQHPEARIDLVGCPVLVSLAEAGWVRGPVATEAIQNYLRKSIIAEPDAIILACTHFSLFQEAMGPLLPEKTVLIDPAIIAATQVAEIVKEYGLSTSKTDTLGTLELYSTDEALRFATVGGLFLGRPIRPEEVTVMQLI